MLDRPYTKPLRRGAPRAEPSPCACRKLRSRHGLVMPAMSALATPQSYEIPLRRRAFQCALASH